jgi:hypothetical protein
VSLDNRDAFTVVSAPGTIAPGETASLEIEAAPFNTGPSTTGVTLESNASGAPSFSFAAEVTASEPLRVTQTTPQRNATDADTSLTGIDLTFNRSVPSGLTVENVTVRGRQSGTIPEADGALAKNENTATFEPARRLQPGELVFASVRGSFGPASVAETVVFTAQAASAPGTFPTATTPPAGLQNASVAAADVDNDQDVDLVVTGQSDGTPSTSLYLNDGNGRFEEAGAGLPNLEAGTVTFADFNDDEAPDLLFTGRTAEGQPATQLFLNDGSGGFDEAVEVGLSSGFSGSAAAVGDVDGDGDLDLALTGATGLEGASTVLYRNVLDESGSLGFVAERTFPGVVGGSIALADLDGDGRLDLLFAGTGGPALGGAPTFRLYRSNSTDGLSRATDSGLSPGLEAARLDIGDVDGDGDLDVAASGTGPESAYLRVYRNELDETGSLGFSPLQSLDARSQGSIDLADLNGDGAPDLLASGVTGVEAPPATDLYVNDGSGGFDRRTGGLPAVERSDAAPADFDGDGDLDVALFGAGDGTPVGGVFANEPAPAVAVSRNGSPVESGQTVDLGTTTTDQALTAALTVANTGDAPLEVGSVSLDNRDAFTVVSAPGTIAPGETASLEIEAAPFNTGPSTTGVTLESNALSSPAFSFAVEVTASEPPRIAVRRNGSAVESGQTVPLGTTPEGTDLTGSFTVANTGGAPLEVGDATVSNADFFSAAAPAAPIPAGESATVEVTLDGAIPGSRSTDVTLESNASGAPSFTFGVEGTVNAAPTVATNAGLALTRGETAPLTTGVLETTDANDDPSALTYTVTTAPSSGELRVNNEPVSSFTQAQIDGGAVAYAHDGSATTSDSFDFTVSDGSASAAGTVAIDVATAPSVAADAPSGVTDAGASLNGTVNPGGAATDVYVGLREIGSGDSTSVQIASLDGTADQTVSTTADTLLPNADYRYRLVAANRADSIVSDAQTFTTASSTPSLAVTGLRPETAAPGTLVRVRGTGFNPSAVQNTVTIGGRQAIPVRALANTIYVRVPDDTPAGPTTVSVAAGEDLAESSDLLQVVAGGSAAFESAGVNLTGVRRSASDWADFDSDGDLDLALVGDDGSDGPGTASARIYENDNGSFTPLEAGLSGTVAGDVAWGDYNGDGAPDLVVVGGSGTTVYRNEGGSFVPTDASLPGLATGSADWGDFDSDGDLDLVLTGQSGGESRTVIYRNQGGGSFAPVGAELTGVHQGSADWGDFDSDGDLDLAVTGDANAPTESAREVAVIYRNDDGTFTPLDAGLNGVRRGSLEWADYNDDGDLDLLVTGFSGGALLYRNDGNGTFSPAEAGLEAVDYSSSDWGDYDGDGDLDLVLTGTNSNLDDSATIYRNTDGSFVPAVRTSLSGVQSGSSSWGDYDGDGDLDLLVSGGGSATLYENVPASGPSVTATAAAGVEETAAAATGTVDAGGAPTRLYLGLRERPPSGDSTFVRIETLAADLDAPQSVEASLDTLQPGTDYRYRLVAANRADSVVSDVQSFATPAVAPTLVTEGPTDLSSSAATLNAAILAGTVPARVTFELTETASDAATVYAADTLREAPTTEQAVAFRTPDTLAAGTEYRVVASAANRADSVVADARTFTTPSAAEPAIAVTRNGASVESGQAVDLGAAAVGESLTADFTVENTGEAPLEVSGLSVGTPDVADATFATALPATVAVGETADFEVALSSDAAGAVSSSVTLESNAGGAPSFSFTAEGTFDEAAAPPAVAVDAPSNVTDTGATLNGAVTPGGAEARVYVGLRENPPAGDSTFAPVDTLAADLASEQAVSTLADTLAPSTDYRYRLVAANRADSVVSGSAAFTTAGAPPTIADLDDRTIDEDTQAGPLPLSISDPDTPADDLQVSATSDTPALLPDSAVTVSGTGAERSLTATPRPDSNGTATVAVTVDDGNRSDQARFTLTVRAVNDAPLARADTVSTPEDTSATVDVLANDRDVEGDALDPASVSIVRAPAHGSASTDAGSDAAPGAIVYSPDEGYAGPDSLAYTVRDARGARSDSTAVRITVAPRPDAPVVATGGSLTATPRSIRLSGAAVDPGGAEARVFVRYARAGNEESAAAALEGGPVDSTEAAESPVAGEEPREVSAAVDALRPGTAYAVEVVARNEVGAAAGEAQLVSTAVAVPAARLRAPAEAGARSARLRGRVAPGGAETDAGFALAPAPLDGDTLVAAADSPVAGADTQAVAASVDSLAPDTEYTVRLRASNRAGRRSSEPDTFRTANPLAVDGPSPLRYGPVGARSSLVRVVTVRNALGEDLPLERIAVAGAPSAGDGEAGPGSAFSVAAPATPPDVLGAGDSVQVRVRFAPASASGDRSATLRVASALETETVRLRGRAAEPPRLAFGRVPVDERRTQAVALTNPLPVPLEVTGLALSGDGAAAYAVSSRPDRLPADTTLALPVAIRPDTSGAYEATLTLDTPRGRFRADLRAEAIGLTVTEGGGSKDEGPPPAGSPVPITLQVPNSFAPDEATLFYRPPGDTAYAQSSLSSGSSGRPAGGAKATQTTLSGEIPADAVTPAGTQYYVSATDASGGEPLTVTYPSRQPRRNPASVQVRIGSVTAAGPAREEAYRMYSIPVNPDSTVADLLRADYNYGPYDPAEWRAFRYPPSLERRRRDGVSLEEIEPQEFPEIDSLGAPGTAFWHVAATADTLEVRDATSVDASEPQRVTLQPGWNQVGSPFPFAVSWQAILDSTRARLKPGSAERAAVNALGEPVAWNAGAGAYEYGQDALLPWRGAFVFNPTVDAPVRLVVPPTSSAQAEADPTTPAAVAQSRLRARTAPSDSTGAPGGTASGADTAGGNASGSERGAYRVQLRARLPGPNGTLTDTENWIGMLPGASGGTGAEDVPEAPPVGRYLRLSVVRSGRARLYSANFKPVAEDGQYWDVEVGARLGRTADRFGARKTVTVRLHERDAAPDGFNLYVLDKDDRRLLPTDDGTFAVDLGDGDPTRHLRVIAGTKAFARQHSDGIRLEAFENALRGNHPNPFADRTTIEYTLKKKSEVRLVVYDLLGRRVRVLVDGQTQEAGPHAVEWSGRRGGRPAASGVYFYRLKAGDFTDSGKLTLVR